MDSTTSGRGETLPQKRPRTNCIIHCSDDDSDSLVSPQDRDSWNTLLRAAEIRQHGPLLELAKGLEKGTIPQELYHRKCRSIFTMKKALDSILSKGATSVAQATTRLPMDAPSSSAVYDRICIFFNKSSKYLKGQNTRESLVQCVEVRADDTIRNAATKKRDQRILALVSRDLVAAEGHYHTSCYKLYTKGEFCASSGVGDTEQGSDAVYEKAERKAYEELFLYIRNELLSNPEVMAMTDLTSRLEKSMNSFGIIQINHSAKKHVRRKLESEFGGSLHFISNDKGKLLLYPDSRSMDDLAIQAYSMKQELQEAKTVISRDVVTKAATHLRNQVKNQEVCQAWPPSIEQSVVPETVTGFLRTLLTGEHECVNPSERVQRLAISFGSDLVFAVTCGRTKPPKHILLPFAVKSLTENTELIRTLNRLGHSVFYSQAEEIDTVLCVQKLGLLKDDLPLPGVFTTLAWDNIDRLSGEGTSHRVNGIAVQSKVAGLLPQNVLPAVTKNQEEKHQSCPINAANLQCRKASWATKD